MDCLCSSSSSKSERVFSIAGNTVTPKRACLAPSKVEQLVTIKTNLRLLRQYGSKIKICFENGVLNFDKNIYMILYQQLPEIYLI